MTTYRGKAAMLMAVAGVVLAGQVQAAPIYWDGANNGLWSLATNWSTVSGAATPNPTSAPGASDDVVFNISTLNLARTIKLDGAQSALSLTFNNTNTTTLTNNVAGETLSLSGNLTVASTAGNVALSMSNLTLAANTTWTNNKTAGTVTVSAPNIAGDSTTGNTRQLTFANTSASTTTVSGAITDGSGGGKVALTVNSSGAGATILSGTNNYTGGTTVTAGTLQIGSGVTGTIVGDIVNNGNVTFARTGSPVLGMQISGTGTVTQNAGNSEALYLSNANNSYSGGTIVATGSIGIGSTIGKIGENSCIGTGSMIRLGTGTFAGTLSYTGPGETTDKKIDLGGTTGGANIQVWGATALVISGDMTASGVGAKWLTLGGDSTRDNTISGKIVDSSGGATSVTKGGNGKWVLSGSNTFTGSLNASQGTLEVTSLAAMGVGTTLTLGSGNNGGTLKYTGGAATVTHAISMPSALSGGGTIDQSGASGLLRFTGDVTNVSGNSAHTLALQGSTEGTGEMAGAISDSLSYPTKVRKNGTGTWTLSGSSSYTGGTVIAGGTLIATNKNSLGAIGSPLEISASTLKLASNDGLNKPSATSITGNSTIALGRATDGPAATTTYELNNLNISNSITLTVTAADHLTGVGMPTLIVSGDTILGASGTTTHTINPTGAIVKLNTVSNAFDNTKTLALGGTTTGNEVTGAITNTAASGTIRVLKQGSGTWTLAGTNNYSGATTITDGLLVVNGSIANSAVAVSGTGRLGGSGTTGAVTITGGTLAPGNSPGILNTGSLALAGTLSADITAGADYDQVNVTGTVNLAGSTLTLDLDSYTNTTDGQLYFLVKNDGNDAIVGTFAGLAEGTTFTSGDYSFKISYLGNAEAVGGPATSGGNDAVLIAAIVPEPAMLMVVVGGMSALGLRRRRR